jgi:hypothetical protein
MRAVNRIGVKVTALLVGKQDTVGVETGLTAEVSSRGGKVISHSAWPPGEMILLSIPGFHFMAAARVVYCCGLAEGKFGATATSLRFSYGAGVTVG